jgi:hypothetical protein
MKKIIFLFAVAIGFFTFKAQAQDGTNMLVWPLQKGQAGISIEKKPYCLVKIQDKLISIDKGEVEKLNTEWIERVDVYKGQEALDLFGQKAKDGAMLITIKKEKEEEVQQFLNTRKE